MKTLTLPVRGVLAVTAAALLMVSAGCTCNHQTPASPGPHQNTASDGKEMKVASPGPHQ